MYVIDKTGGRNNKVRLSVQTMNTINAPVCFIPAETLKHGYVAGDIFKQKFYCFSYTFCDRSYWNHNENDNNEQDAENFQHIEDDGMNSNQHRMMSAEGAGAEVVNTAEFILSSERQQQIVAESNTLYDINELEHAFDEYESSSSDSD
jgi:hypothetical protein